MTPPTQSDARWEFPEWLVEKAADAIHASANGEADTTYADDASAAFAVALSECPVLGLTKEEVDALERGRHLQSCSLRARHMGGGWNCRCGLESAKAKLLATREALERGGDG